MKSMKRFIAVFLAAIMLFSSFSLLASAEIGDGNQSTIEFDTKFYRNTGTDSSPVWTETTKAAPGEEIKVRFFMTTDFGIGASEFFWVWSKKSLTMSSDYTANKLMTVVTNPDENSEAYISEIGGDFKLDTEWNTIAINLVNCGLLPEEICDDYGYLYIQLTEGNSTYLSGDYWLYEFDFTVSENPEGSAQIYAPANAIATADEATWDSTIFIGKHDDSKLGINVGRNNQESYDWYPIIINNDTDADSTLSFDNTITFKNGTTDVATYTGTIGTLLSDDTTFTVPTASASGQKFLGWSLDGTTVLTDAEVKATAYDYEAVTLTAVFESASASYVQNVYTMGTDGTYGEPATENIPAATDDKVNASTYAVPEGFTLDTDMSTAGDVTVTSDGTAALNIYLKRNSYDVVFNNEDGTEAATLPGLYGATVTAPAADEKAGWTFTGWSDGTNSYDAGAAVTVPLNGVTLTATYTENTDTPYTVNIYTMDINGVYGDAETVDGTVGKTGATVTYTAAPGEGLYLDEAKSTTDLSTVITADDTDVINVYYARNSYEVKVDGVAAGTVYHGATFTAPSTSTTTKTGYTLTGWTVDGTTYAVGDAITVTSAIELVAVNTANTHTLTYTVDGEWPLNYEEPAAKAVKFDDTFTLADLEAVAPVTGYEFSGWTVASGATYDDATGVYTVTGDVEVIAEWSRNEYRILYYLTEQDYEDGVIYSSASYYYGDTIDADYAPDAEDILGKEFIEWEVVDGGSMPETMPAGNIYAIASTNEYEVLFYDEYGDISAEFYGIETVTDANAPDMTSDEFDFGGWLVNGETDKEKAVTTFSYDVTSNYYFVPVCTVDVVYYTDYDENGDPANEYKTLTYDFGYTPAEDDAQLAALGTPVKEGHSFDGWDFDIVDNELTSHNYAVAQWTAKAYTATFNAVNGDLAGAFTDDTTVKEVTDVTYGTEITFADVPELEGYTFQGWTDVEGGTVKVDPLKMDKEGKTFYAIYTANGEAGYTVEIYLMGTDGKYADTATTTDTTKTGTIGVEATVAHADYIAQLDSYFSADADANNVLSEVVAADGSTVLKLYYARASYEVKVDGVAQAEKVYHGATFTAPATSTTTEAGYTLTGWTVDGTTYAVGDAIPVTSAIELTAVNTANTDTAYTVNIYTMDTNGVYGDAVKVEGTVGTTGETVTYTAEDKLGFVVDTEKSTKDLSTVITADDTDVINVYYERLKYNVIYKANDEKVDELIGVYFGEELVASANYTAPAGYELLGWSAYSDATTPDSFLGYMELGDVTIYAVLKAGTSTYTIKTYTMGLDGEYGEAVVTTDTYTTDETVTYTAPVVDGFTADKDSYSVKVTGDGNAEIEVYYVRNTYEVTVDGVAAGTVYHGATFTAPDSSTAVPTGYHLTGWSDGTTDYAIGEAITVTAPLAITAKYDVNTDTAYKVEIYTMDANGNYALAYTDNKTGTTGEKATAAHADYIADLDDFYLADADNENNVTKAEIAGDGSTTLKLYFKRASYNYSFTANGAEVEAGTVYHGATIKTPEYTPDAGYTFGGWTDGTNTYAANTNISVESDLVYTAIITANTGIAYTVETHVMNTDGTTYEVTTETLYGKTGDTVVANHVAMDGFSPDTANSVLSGTIAADDSTVLKVVYSRNSYEITIDGETDEYYYGEEIDLIPVPEDEIADGYEQDGWVDEDGNPVDDPYIVDEDNPTEIKPNIVPITYTVEFTVNGETFVSAEAAYGTDIQDPGTPGEEWIPEGHSFGGWSVDGVTEVTDFGTVGVGGNTFVAILNKLSYNLTFKDAEGNVLSGPTSTEFGSTLAALAPTAPDKTDAGLIFAGWAEEADETAKMPATMPAKDVVYKATYVQNTTPVKYSIQVYMMDTNGDYTLSATTVSYGYIGTTQTIEAGDVLGCSVDTEKSHLSDVIASDGSTVLTIYYARNIYTVTFGDNEPVDVYYGAAIPVPADPESTEEGQVFAGWTPEVPATMPADNLVFEATWAPGVYTITYVINGETKEPVSYTYGEAVATPETPSVSGLKFVGWTPEVPDTMPAKDLIIVAEFEADLFKVTFLDDVDGEVFDVKYVAYGDEITLPTGEPTKEYHTFAGWLAVPDTMPAEDIVIVPDFERVPVSLVEQPGSTTFIDRENNVIYGLSTRMRASAYEDTYLDVVGDGYFTVTPADGKAGFYGTGTVISLYDNNSETDEPIEVYYVVIFGDVNGDSDVNAADASAVEDEYFWVTAWSREGSDEYAYYKLRAGDLDNDGDIDVNDHTNIVNYTVGVIAIDQTTGTVER